MKIGITCYPTYGGSGAVATELGLDLANRGHEVHFISYAQPFRLGHFRERIFFHEVEMDHYPLFEHPPYSLALAVAIHDTALNHGLDLVHVHYAIPHATSAWIAIEDFAVPAERIRVIPNFIDPNIFRRDRKPCHRATLAPKGEKILMHISNFRPVKRIPDVVEVFARISKEVPSRLVLVGDGPERPRALERAEELGVKDGIVFLGKHSSVDELLACADLFLLPSRNESFGLAALEALACGTPVIATETGGLPELVTHGETGYLFPLGAVDEMADAGLALLKDPRLWTRVSESARSDAVDRFSNDRIVPLYEELYREVVSGEFGRAVGHD